jgi:hypothetical protein
MKVPLEYAKAPSCMRNQVRNQLKEHKPVEITAPATTHLLCKGARAILGFARHHSEGLVAAGTTVYL